MTEVLDARPDSPKRGRRIGRAILVVLVLVTLGGGGAVAGYFAAGAINTDPDTEQQLNKPKLMSKDGSPITMALADLKAEKQAPKISKSTLQATYYPIEDPFTSNLKNSNNFAQLSISIATYYDERVLENIREHETAIRSSVLMTLAEQEVDTLSTHQGKQVLQQLLTDIINKVLDEKAGFGGVDNVYFTSFVVQ